MCTKSENWAKFVLFSNWILYILYAIFKIDQEGFQKIYLVTGFIVFLDV